MELDGPGPLYRRRLLAAGWTDDEVRARVRSGELLAVRRGAYLRADERPRDAEAWHAVTVRAALPDLAPQVVISHASAVVLHGLPVWGFPLDRIHATRARRSGARRSAGLHLHAAPLEPADIESADGVPVTSGARTVVDMCRSVPFEQAVVLADAALHRGLTTTGALREALQRAAGRPGCPRARRAIVFADGRSESVGESRSRVAMLRAGLPAPVLQWPFPNRAGRALGRVDFWWPQFRTVGEFDGRIKVRDRAVRRRRPAPVARVRLGVTPHPRSPGGAGPRSTDQASQPPHGPRSARTRCATAHRLRDRTPAAQPTPAARPTIGW